MTQPDRETIVEALAAMSESEFADTIEKARGHNNPQDRKLAAASALKRFISGKE